MLIQKVLLTLSFLLYLFWTFRLGVKQGFNRTKILDLAIFAPAAGVLAFKFASSIRLDSESFFFLGFLAFVYFWGRRETWSAQRLGDIFSESLTLAAVFFPYFQSPLFNLFALVIFYLIRKVGQIKVKSSFIFLSFLVLFGPFFGLLTYVEHHRWLTPNLVLAVVLFLWGVLGLRNKVYRESMELLKFTLPKELLKGLEEKLLKKQADLEAEERALKLEGKSLDAEKTEDVEEEDRALVAEEEDRTGSMLEFIRARKNEVVLALRKIKDGNYGLCESCRKPIDKARLLAYPEARFCLEHEPKEEEKEKQKENSV